MKNYTKIGIAILIILGYIYLTLIVEEQHSLDSHKAKESKYRNVERAMSKNRRERNLSRQHGKNLKTIFDYVDK